MNRITLEYTNNHSMLKNYTCLKKKQFVFCSRSPYRTTVLKMEISTFLGPKWHSTNGSMLFHRAQRSLYFQGHAHSPPTCYCNVFARIKKHYVRGRVNHRSVNSYSGISGVLPLSSILPSREYWMMYSIEDQAFSPSYDLPSPLSVRSTGGTQED